MKRLLGSILLPGLAIFAGLAAPRPATAASDAEIRAIWVTRYEFNSTDTVRAILKNCADYHFNVILFQVRGNGTVFYRSKLEPWAWEINGKIQDLGKDPGWDPLAVACVEAHRLGLQLHAYMNTYPGWKETTPPSTEVKQLWNTHRDWFACAKDGTVMWPHDWWTYWYTFLSPAHPEARLHIHKVYMEVLDNYPVDGIHYDYIRYPGEVGDYSWNPLDVALFTAEHMASPDDKPEEWAQFKRDAITALVDANYKGAKERGKKVMFSASVIGDPEKAVTTYFQDSPTWVKRGIIDCCMPMLYLTDTDLFAKRVKEHLKTKSARFVVPGINAGRNDIDGLLKEIQISRDLGCNGVALFSYSALFKDHQPTEKASALLEGPFAKPVPVPERKWD